MLEIRAEQLKTLEGPVRADFVARIERFLREQLPEHCACPPGQELGPSIERGIEAAARHGIERRWDVCRFVACQRVLGEGFDTDPAHPWPQRVLARPDLRPTRKMDWIERHYLRRYLRRTHEER